MTLALSLATFASIVCALGGAFIASALAKSRHRRSVDALAAQHASTLALAEARASQSAASQHAMEQALALDRVGTASAHALVADACSTSGASVATLADANGLALAWSGDHSLAEDLAALAPDALGVLKLGETLVLRGAYGGEVRGVCVRFGGERQMLFFGSGARAIGASALALLRLKLERLDAQANEGEISGPAAPRRLERARAMSVDLSLSAMAQGLDLAWMVLASDGFADGRADGNHAYADTDFDLRVGGSPPAGVLDEVTMFERIARRSPGGLCDPLASVQRLRTDGSSAWLSMGALGSVTVAGAISDEPNTLPRIAASIARRLTRETSRAA